MKHASLKSETEYDIRIYVHVYERAQSDKSLFTVQSMNYDVCQQLQPQNTINNVTTVQLQLTESITLTLGRNLTGCDLTEKLTHTSRTLRKSQPMFH
jgi:hypothetical protein